MHKKILLPAALLVCVATVWGQKTTALTGTVTDSKSTSIPKASVYILNTNYGTLTDEQGKFQLGDLKPGKYQLNVSAVGYGTFNEEINTAEKNDVTIVLTEADVHLDEVVVSAQKKEELLQQLPFSISALSSSKVKDYRLWRNKDITAIIPNLYSANPGDDRNVTSIRGITSTSYDPAVATYVDGVNQFSLDTYIPQLFDIERVEVLRGPQGTLYGRNAMGGVINIITKAPTNETNGFAELNFGNYNQQRYNVAIRTPIVKNKLFFGASVMYNSFDGFYTNDFNNSHFDKQHSITGNYYLKYLASQRWALTLNVKHHNNRNNGPFSLVNGVDEAFSTPFHLNQNATTQMVDNTFNASLSVNYTGPSVNFTSQTAWQTNQRYYKKPIDGDFSPIDGITIINNYGSKWNNVKALTQEFRFTSPASVSSPWKWTTGVYLFYQDVPNKQAYHFGENGDLLGAEKNTSVITTSTGKNTGAAFFGQATYEVNRRLQVTGGIRYDYEHKKQSVLSQYQIDPDPTPVFDIRPDTSANGNFSSFSPKVSVNYLITKNNIIYGTYSRGFRAGGFTQISSDPSQPPLFKFKPEYSSSYEVGVKNDLLGSKLRLNIAFFYTLVNNAQVPILVLPDAVTITKNAGDLRSKGAEAEIAITPVKNLEINYNFGYTDAKYTSSAVLKVDQNGDEVNLKDKRQIYTPKTTSALAVQYGYGIGSKQHLKLVIRGEWMNLGSQYFDLANTIKQSSYSLFNARFGIAAKNFEVMLWGRNLGDKRYISYAYDFGAIHLGDPKTYGVTLTGKF
jgi:iron complex outermembrane recepter protein